MLLAIDTSSGSSAALVDYARGILAERTIADTMRHAEVIGVLIEQVLTEAKIEPADLSGVAVGMGPGPFTGLRVGIAAARAFAFGAGLRVIPVVSHDAIALQHFRSAANSPLLVVTDARRREVYWSAYSGVDSEGLPVRTDGPGLCKPADLPHQDHARTEISTVSAAALGEVACALKAHGRQFADGEALYLRSPDVTPSAGSKRVTG